MLVSIQSMHHNLKLATLTLIGIHHTANMFNNLNIITMKEQMSNSSN